MMTPTQEAWRLLRYDWKRYWPELVFTWLFSLLLGALAAMMLNGLADPGDSSSSISLNGLMLDFYFIFFIPMFTVIWGREYWYPLKMREMFDRRLSILRILPVSTAGFVRSRMFQVLGLALLCSSAFFSTIYIIGWMFRQWLTPGEFLVFAAIWFGYGLAVGGIYPLVEWGTTSRWTYWWISALILLACPLLVWSHWLWTEISWIERTVQWASQAPWAGPLALLIGYGGMAGWSLLIERRLIQRDL
ncbi:hypothetical protein [Desmospora profundinema]|uniref:Magnesium-transporting ATPase (P-type) n=1 Tax=Desmospora profundinema TaxID=1571184 RepID=A0ABU1IKS9_9BACL|nr:hypothetical protein [Desmospora profundinema]MDR6225353.1 magnesium-transporting ATPase (P-type) [Desmospora profundinema]